MSLVGAQGQAVGISERPGQHLAAPVGIESQHKAVSLHPIAAVGDIQPPAAVEQQVVRRDDFVIAGVRGEHAMFAVLGDAHDADARDADEQLAIIGREGQAAAKPAEIGDRL